MDRHLREAAQWLEKLQHPHLSPQQWLRWKEWQRLPENRKAFDSLEPVWRAILTSSDDLNMVGRLHATPQPRADSNVPNHLRRRGRSVSREAAYWYIHCNDDPAMRWSHRNRFAVWLKRSPENIAEFLRIFIIADSLSRRKTNAESGKPRSDASYDTSRPHTSIVKALGKWCSLSISKVSAVQWGKAALAFLLLCAPWNNRFVEIVSTPAGKWQHMTLSDGSVVHVGARTRLMVDISERRRRVRLYQGEAVFEVAKDSTRPFTITTSLVDVTAVGTKLGVSVDPGVTATVSEGVVIVTADDKRNNGREVTLRANEQLRVPASGLGLAEVSRVNAAKTLEWANGWFIFQGETIEEAAMEFNRRNVEQIEIAQPEVAARELHGYYRFRVDAPTDFAREVAALNGLTLTEDRSGKVVRLRLEDRRG